MRVSRHWIVAVLLPTVAAGLWLSCSSPDASRDDLANGGFGPELRALLSQPAEGFPAPRERWPFSFPADHGPHPTQRSEWWYLSGSLQDGEGRHLGLQLLFVRFALTPLPRARSSRWALHQLYAALFSVSDPGGNRLLSGTRLSRDAAGLAGASGDPLQLWVEDWRLEQGAGPDPEAAGLSATLSLDGARLRLRMFSLKPVLDENRLGSSNDTPAPFHYYLRPRLRTTGELRQGPRRLALRGTLALEHAWGDLPLPGGPVALDRFVLHLDDNRDLFLLRRHRADGGGIPATAGVLIGADASAVALRPDEIELHPMEHWLSPVSGARYPVRWRLDIPEWHIHVELKSRWRDQEGQGWTNFWGGSVAIRHAAPGTGTAGRGFMQLTGYDPS